MFQRSTYCQSLRRGRLVGPAIAGALISTVLAVTTATAATTAPVPATPAGLPSGIEGLAAYVPADSCDPVQRVGTNDLGQLLTATYAGTTYATTRSCGSDPLPTSEHYDGRAVDWMVSVRTATGRADAKALLHWLFATDAAGDRYAMARRLGVMYVIWDNRIWGAYRTQDGWRAYSSCAAHPARAWDTTCHRNHMHLSLSWEGATGRTSFWSGQVAAPDFGPCRAKGMNWAGRYNHANPTPCTAYPYVRAPKGSTTLRKHLVTYSGMRIRHGSAGTPVSTVQKVVDGQVTGRFGWSTRAAVKRWQTRHGLSATGVVNVSTWRTLLAR